MKRVYQLLYMNKEGLRDGCKGPLKGFKGRARYVSVATQCQAGIMVYRNKTEAIEDARKLNRSNESTRALVIELSIV